MSVYSRPLAVLLGRFQTLDRELHDIRGNLLFRLLVALFLVTLPVAAPGQGLEGKDPEEVLKELGDDENKKEESADESSLETEEPEAHEEGLTVLLDAALWKAPILHSASFAASRTDFGLLLPAGETSGWAIYEIDGPKALLLGQFESCRLSLEAAAEPDAWKPVGDATKADSSGFLAFGLPVEAGHACRVRVTLEKPQGRFAWLRGLTSPEGKTTLESPVQQRPTGDATRWQLVSSLPVFHGTRQAGDPSACEWTLEMRGGPTERECSAREWLRLDEKRPDRWFGAGDNFVQARLRAEGNLARLPPRITLALRERPASSPGSSTPAPRSFGFSQPLGLQPGSDPPPIFLMRRTGCREIRLSHRDYVLEFDEPRRINLASILMGQGIRRPRELLLETYDAPEAQWKTAAVTHPDARSVAVVTFPPAVTRGVRVRVPWGSGEIRGLEARSLPALISEFSSPVFTFLEAGRNRNEVPVMSENEFRFKLVSLSGEMPTAVLSASVRTWHGDKEKILASIDKPITIDPNKDTEESVLFACGRTDYSMAIRFRLRHPEALGRVLQSLSYPAVAAPHLEARLLSPGYRHTVYASQKLEEIEVLGIAAVPQKALSGLKQLSIRLSLYRKEPGYRIREYRTTDMEGLNQRRYRLRLAPMDTPPGHFKTLVTLHAPPVMNQITLGEDDVYLAAAAASEVWLDLAGGFRINGAAFFPLGVKNVPEDETLFQELAAAGINTVHADQPSPRYLELAGKHGLKVIAGLNASLNLHSYSSNEEKEKLRQIVATIQNSPHLLAYQLAEAAVKHLKPVEQRHDFDWPSFRTVYRILFETDAYHPVIGSVGPDADLPAWSAAVDVFGCFLGSEGLPIESKLHLIEEARIVAQANAKGVIAQLPALPAPELRCLLYGAIASGCEGILLDARCWPEARPLVSEVAKRIPALLGEEGKLALGSAAFPFPALYRVSEKGEILVLVNNLPVARPLPLRVRWPGGRTLREIQSGRALKIMPGEFTEDFSPYEVKVFE